MAKQKPEPTQVAAAKPEPPQIPVAAIPAAKPVGRKSGNLDPATLEKTQFPKAGETIRGGGESSVVIHDVDAVPEVE